MTKSGKKAKKDLHRGVIRASFRAGESSEFNSHVRHRASKKGGKICGPAGRLMMGNATDASVVWGVDAYIVDASSRCVWCLIMGDFSCALSLLLQFKCSLSS